MSDNIEITISIDVKDGGTSFHMSVNAAADPILLLGILEMAKAEVISGCNVVKRHGLEVVDPGERDAPQWALDAREKVLRRGN